MRRGSQFQSARGKSRLPVGGLIATRRCVRRPVLPRLWPAALGAGLIAALLLALHGCHGPMDTSPPPARPDGSAKLDLPTSASIQREPVMRVRIARRSAQVTVRANPSVTVSPASAGDGSRRGRRFRAPLHITRRDGQFMLSTGDGDFQWRVPRLRLSASSRDMLTINQTRYPGTVVLVPLQQDGRETGALDVVNHVSLERYLPGVIEGELWPHWHDEAFAAQAIAARTYALYERHLHRDRHFDLTSTTASQVYGGESKHRRAAQAVRRTRGQVVAFHGQLVPTFYSSTCGGTSQTARFAFTDVPSTLDLPPLRSERRRAWCAASKHYRWGPITRSRASLTRRLARWGRSREHAIASLSSLQDIAITARTSAGRPTRFTVTGADGARYTLAAERFRFACNQAVSGLPELKFERKLRSSHVVPSVRGNTVRFADGRGWGHGVGMCQWGAQGMASGGYDATTILRTFYPGARVQRVY